MSSSASSFRHRSSFQKTRSASGAGVRSHTSTVDQPIKLDPHLTIQIREKTGGHLMKTFVVYLGVLCALALNTAAQTAHPEPRVIEVSASAERWVTPDEFTFKITLLERIENKQKITIEQQETALRTELSALGVDVAKDLSVYDISSAYIRQKKVRDVLSSKDYRLKLRDLNKIARLQE